MIFLSLKKEIFVVFEKKKKKILDLVFYIENLLTFKNKI